MEFTSLLDLLWKKIEKKERRIHFFSGHQLLNSFNTKELWNYAQACAAHIKANCSSQYIILSLPTGPEFLGHYFGAFMLGRVVVPVISQEYSRKADLSEYLESISQVLGDAALISFNDTPGAKSFEPRKFEKMLVEGEAAAPDVTPKGSDVAIVQFSSGSTAKPKGVILTHDNILTNLRQIHSQIQTKMDDNIATWLPLYHDMGLVGGFLSPLYFGLEIFLHSPVDFVRDPIAWINFVSNKKVSVIVGPDFMYRTLARRAEGLELNLDLSRLRICMTGSEPVRAETLRDFSRVFSPYGLRPETLMPVYGMAEAVLGVTFHRVNTPFKSVLINKQEYEKSILQISETKSGREIVSCGVPLEGVQVEIRDEGGKVTPPNCIGVIYFKSPAQTQGFVNNPEATAELVKDGWINTGDLGFTLHGELFISGRVKDVIIHRGRKIHAIDLEGELLKEFKWIRKVAVVALGEDQIGVAIETRDAVWKSFRSRRTAIANFVQRELPISPENVALFSARTLPVTSSGKLRRFRIRDMILKASTSESNPSFFRRVHSWIEVQKQKAQWAQSTSWRVDPVREEIVFAFLSVTGRERSEINWAKSIMDYGIDSVQMMELMNELERRLGAIQIADFYKLKTLEDVYFFFKKSFR